LFMVVLMHHGLRDWRTHYAGRCDYTSCDVHSYNVRGVYSNDNLWGRFPRQEVKGYTPRELGALRSALLFWGSESSGVGDTRTILLFRGWNRSAARANRGIRFWDIRDWDIERLFGCGLYWEYAYICSIVGSMIHSPLCEASMQ
jgi:hypothetical protein